MEEWRDIQGFEGLYQVSNLGRVKSLVDNKGNYREKILILLKRGNGYLFVRIYNNKKPISLSVHRLVANAFIPNPNNYPIVNHINEIKDDNRVENLEWCTFKYNSNYGFATEKMSQKKSKQVYQYDKNLNLIKIWDSTKECGENSFIQQAVSDCCIGKRKSHKGFLWSYEDIKKEN